MLRVTESRSERRRAQTRASLLSAAADLFAEKGVGDTRISEITDRADVGAGSFYNHFEDKDAIVQALLADLAAAHGEQVDVETAQIEDPAEVVAHAHGHFIRVVLQDPTFGQLMLRLDASHGLIWEILGPRALRDIESGIAKGRFDVEDALSASFSTGGALMGTISGIADGVLDESATGRHIQAVLRMLGVPAAEAKMISGS